MSRDSRVSPDSRPGCCPLYPDAVELIGRRWTGAIVATLMDAHPSRSLRFGEIAQAVPQLSDRMLAERLRELEARGVVERRISSDSPSRVAYALTDMGAGLEPAVVALKAWAQHWLEADEARTAPRAN
jgi:DNA-binding HxlR family transcriptional regulator